MLKNEKATKKPTQHNFVRTSLASLFGLIAVFLILTSLLTVWLNRTLTNTDTFVATVTPLAQRPEVSNFIATKITTTIAENATSDELSAKLLKAEEITGISREQANQKAIEVIDQAISTTLSSPEFTKLWESTNRTIHQGVIKQLESEEESLKIDFGPTINEVKAQLATTRMQPIVDKIEIKDGQAVVNIDGGSFESAREGYQKFKTFSLLIVLLALIFATLAIITSTHHLKTLRRILISSGVLIIIFGLLLEAPGKIKTDNISQIDKDFGLALADVLTKDLQTACFVIGIVFIVTALLTKFIPRLKKSS